MENIAVKKAFLLFSNNLNPFKKNKLFNRATVFQKNSLDIKIAKIILENINAFFWFTLLLRYTAKYLL
jgi:hypothetical protein